jgi:membrane fusion protein (multidrug efflux system)
MKYSSILICLAVLSIFGCQHHEHHTPEETKFVVTSPVKTDTLIYHEYVGQIHSIQHIELRTLEKGYLQNIYVDEGKPVKKGQRLFQVMPVINKAEVQKARAEVSFAEIEFQNTENLADSNIVSANELALAKATLEKAEAQLALAQAHLTFTNVRAPFDGIVGRFNDVRLGSLVDEGELLTTLSDNRQMWVYFNVPEAEYLDYVMRPQSDSASPVKLRLANHQLFNQEGVVETIEADFNNETGNIAFRATFQNPEGILRNGETGNILLPVSLKNVLLIPQKATFEILDRRYVYVVDENNTIKSREIKVGAEIPHIYEVVSGLEEKDKILVDGLRKVKNGQQIAYDFYEQEQLWAELNQLHAE